MAFYATLHCPVSTTPNLISILTYYRSGSEAYVEITSQYAVTSNLVVVIQVTDDCSSNVQQIDILLTSGNTFAWAYSSGLGACGNIMASPITISPSSDGTYSYHF